LLETVSENDFYVFDAIIWIIYSPKYMGTISEVRTTVHLYWKFNDDCCNVANSETNRRTTKHQHLDSRRSRYGDV